MNKYSRKYSLLNTNYANPHGLMHNYNKSSAFDCAVLSLKAMNDPFFKTIVSTRFYKSSVFSNFTKRNRTICWENTNKLLEKNHWNGLKTGITLAAGPCLSASYENKNFNGKISAFVIVILNSKSMDIRWSECERLVEWGQKNLL